MSGAGVLPMMGLGEQTPEEYTELGYANMWLETPEIVANCKHQRQEKELGRCKREMSCPICRYKYKVDSSG